MALPVNMDCSSIASWVRHLSIVYPVVFGQTWNAQWLRIIELLSQLHVEPQPNETMLRLHGILTSRIFLWHVHNNLLVAPWISSTCIFVCTPICLWSWTMPFPLRDHISGSYPTIQVLQTSVTSHVGIPRTWCRLLAKKTWFMGPLVSHCQKWLS